MFGFKHAWIFKSRWIALLWAAGICWFAVDVASSSKDADANVSSNAAQTDAMGMPVTPDDLKRIEDNLKTIQN